MEPPTQAGPAGARLGGGTAGWILSEVLGPTWGGLFRARALALPPRAASRSPVFSRVLGAPPLVFVLEYYLDTLWKGTLLFIVCILLISFGLVSEVWAPGPAHTTFLPRGPGPASPPAPTAAQGVPAAPAGAEAGDLGLPCLRRGRGPVAYDLVAAAAPPGAEPRAWRVPLLHPGPHRVSGPHAPGLRAPGPQLGR